MIRAFLASTLSVLGVGMAVALVGPDLIAGPQGEPLRVSAPDPWLLQPASFDAASCAAALFFAEDEANRGETPATRVVALSNGGGHLVAIQTVSQGDALVDVVFLVFDRAGRLVAAGSAPALTADIAAAAADACAADGPPAPGAPV